MKKVILSFILFVVFFTGICQQKTAIQIIFEPVFGNGDLVTENVFYKPNNGNDSLQFETLTFYISNLQLLQNKEVVYTEANSFHLLDAADNSTMKMQLQLPTKLRFNSLEFNIGIDSATNVSGALGGDLDPTKGMYWTWQSGYINVKVEGTDPMCSSPGHAFQFHLGGYQNPYNSLQKVSVNLRKNETVILLDLKRFIQGINLSKQHHIMSPGKDAVRLSGIFAKCFRTK